MRVCVSVCLYVSLNERKRERRLNREQKGWRKWERPKDGFLKRGSVKMLH